MERKNSSRETRSYRIAITGASGTGKTTLANSLGETLGLPVIAENFAAVHHASVALAQARQRGVPLHEPMKRFLIACDNWIKSRIEQQNALGVFIEDRFCFDIVSTVLVSSEAAAMQPALLMDLIHGCRQKSAVYDLVIIPPISDWTLNAGHNEDGLPRQQSFARMLRAQAIRVGLLEQYCPVQRLYLTEYEATTSQRVEKVLEVLSSGYPVMS